MRQLVVLDREKVGAGVKRLQLLKDEWERKQTTTADAQNYDDGTLIEEVVSGADGYQGKRLGPWAQMLECVLQADFNLL
ncbi:unnamed protein product [Phytophthora fragariaefolia]|uniref:Unnamed protein product n=1 Tax=Phytophthora fragariaefolia TaxID=1490495 RepID=A0A9W6XSE3_9STRA|nr:unnamed protein product [Phytophthora fragariaefolia]